MNTSNHCSQVYQIMLLYPLEIDNSLYYLSLRTQKIALNITINSIAINTDIQPLGSFSTISGLSKLYNAPNVPLFVAGDMPSRATLKKGQ